MREPNFKCPKTGKEFHIVQYRTGFTNSGEKVYKDKWGKVLTNPDNGEELVAIDREVDFTNANIFIGTGTDKAGIAKRQQQLQQRSKQHFKKEISEQKYEKNKKIVKKYKGEQ